MSKASEIIARVLDIEARTMPEGMEWPKFEDGAPVSIGDRIKIADGEWGRVDQIQFTRNKCDLITNRPGVGYITIRDGKRVERPQVIAADGKPVEVGQMVYANGDPKGDGTAWKVVGLINGRKHCVMCERKDREVRELNPRWITHEPSVIAADGERIEVGQEVYRIDHDSTYIVKRIDGGLVYINTGESLIDLLCGPNELIHKRQVFDTDGVPIKEGDNVWLTEEARNSIEFTVKGEPLKVTGFTLTSTVACLDQGDLSKEEYDPWYIDPKNLTHIKPEPSDTWERIEADCSMKADDYARERMGIDPKSVPPKESRKVDMARDLVRRCKELAEGGRDEQG